MNRRHLLKRLGAAVVATPALVVTATKPVEAAEPVLATEEQVEEIVAYARYQAEALGYARGYQRGYDIATARAESRADDRFLAGYDKGVERGLQAKVHERINLEYMAREVVAEIDDTYVAAAVPLSRLPDR